MDLMPQRAERLLHLPLPERTHTHTLAHARGTLTLPALKLSNDFPLRLRHCSSQPVFVFPATPATFDMQRFVLRVMAVDFRSKKRPAGKRKMKHPDDGERDDGNADAEHDGLAVPPERLDTQTCVESQGFHAFVHHFSLADCAARGYQRSACVCYVTSDPVQVSVSFGQLQRTF